MIILWFFCVFFFFTKFKIIVELLLVALQFYPQYIQQCVYQHVHHYFGEMNMKTMCKTKSLETRAKISAPLRRFRSDPERGTILGQSF